MPVGACDKRLGRLISYIHNTSQFRQYYHVGNTAEECSWASFQDSDIAGDPESLNRPRRDILRIFGSPTNVPRTWTCKKQIFGRTQYHGVGGHLFRHWLTDGLPVLDLWDSVIGVPHSSVRGNSLRSDDSAQSSLRRDTCEQQSTGRTKPKTSYLGWGYVRKKSNAFRRTPNKPAKPLCSTSLRTVGRGSAWMWPCRALACCGSGPTSRCQVSWHMCGVTCLGVRCVAPGHCEVLPDTIQTSSMRSKDLQEGNVSSETCE